MLKLRIRPVRLSVTFLVLRAGEVAALILALILGGGAHAALMQGFDWPTSVYGEFHGAWIAAKTYYFTFGYFYLSAIVFLLLQVLYGIGSKMMLSVANLGPFIVHSLAVIVLVFDGRIGSVLWVIWFSVLAVNWLLPKVLWNITFRGDE